MYSPGKQRGMALIALLLMLILGITALLTTLPDSPALQIGRERITLDSMTKAREALISDAVTQAPIASAGYLRLPDLGFRIGNVPAEGSAAPNFGGNGKDYPVMGKLPWRTLGLEPLRDGQGECLWYVVSGRFKSTPATDTLNWDTEGQIDLADGNGNLIAASLAAVIVAPGKPLDGQEHTLSNAAYVQCRGNYDARNYLDPYIPSSSISGAPNYFNGSTNSRVSSGSGNKLLVITENAHYNDRFLPIRREDIFRALVRRSNFAAGIAALMGDAYFRDVPITGSKGTDGIDCKLLNSDNRAFCKNWKEMLLLTQLPAPAPIVIDGATSSPCSRVLIFGGQKNSSQQRMTAPDKSSPANYLEGTNRTAFAAPVAAASSFSGTSGFKSDQPSADLLKCLP